MFNWVDPKSLIVFFKFSVIKEQNQNGVVRTCKNFLRFWYLLICTIFIEQSWTYPQDILSICCPMLFIFGYKSFLVLLQILHFSIIVTLLVIFNARHYCQHVRYLLRIPCQQYSPLCCFPFFLFVFVQWSIFRHKELSACDVIVFKKKFHWRRKVHIL